MMPVTCHHDIYTVSVCDMMPVTFVHDNHHEVSKFVLFYIVADDTVSSQNISYSLYIQLADHWHSLDGIILFCHDTTCSYIKHMQTLL